jgi:hypothetical protein
MTKPEYGYETEAAFFAQEHYNIPRKDFVKLAKKSFKSMSQLETTMREFDTIQSDLRSYNEYLER